MAENGVGGMVKKQFFLRPTKDKKVIANILKAQRRILAIRKNKIAYLCICGYMKEEIFCSTSGFQIIYSMS